MKIIFTIVSLVFMLSSAQANVVCDVPRSTAKEDLKESLLNTYGSSYSTVKMLLDAGMKDYDNICRLPDNSVNNRILKNLNSTYYPSFSTIHMLYKANIKDYNALNN